MKTLQRNIVKQQNLKKLVFRIFTWPNCMVVEIIILHNNNDSYTTNIIMYRLWIVIIKYARALRPVASRAKSLNDNESFLVNTQQFIQFRPQPGRPRFGSERLRCHISLKCSVSFLIQTFQQIVFHFWPQLNNLSRPQPSRGLSSYGRALIMKRDKTSGVNLLSSNFYVANLRNCEQCMKEMLSKHDVINTTRMSNEFNYKGFLLL